MSEPTPPPPRPRYTLEERRAAVDAALAKMAELKETLEQLHDKLDPHGP